MSNSPHAARSEDGITALIERRLEGCHEVLNHIESNTRNVTNHLLGQIPENPNAKGPGAAVTAPGFLQRTDDTLAELQNRLERLSSSLERFNGTL